MKRIIPLGTMKKNFLEVYKMYKERFKEGYNLDCFNLAEEEIDESKDPKMYEFIIENGFLIYILMDNLLDLNLHIIYGNHENNEFLYQFSFTSFLKKEKKVFQNYIFVEIFDFAKTIITAIYHLYEGYYFLYTFILS